MYHVRIIGGPTKGREKLAIALHLGFGARIADLAYGQDVEILMRCVVRKVYEILKAQGYDLQISETLTRRVMSDELTCW